MIQPLTELTALGDVHMVKGLSHYRILVEGSPVFVEDSTDMHMRLRKFIDRSGARAITVGDTVTDAWTPEDEVAHRNFFLGRNYDMPAMGNHDVLGVLPQELREVENTFETGYKNSGVIWKHEIVDNRVSVILLHNIQDVFDAGSWQYANVNPAGGYAANDWGGIASAASPQRQFLTAALADAHANNRHVVVVGHRPAYSVSPVSIRPNHVEALAAGGYIKELEDWSNNTGRNPILIAGDVHSYSLTDPIRSGAAQDKGVIHLTVSSGPSLRDLSVALQPYHRSYVAGDPGALTIAGPPLTDLSTSLSWLWTDQQNCIAVKLKWYQTHLAIETYLIFTNWMAAFYPETKLPNNALLVDRFQADIINGKLTGKLRRCMPCAESLRKV